MPAGALSRLRRIFREERLHFHQSQPYHTRHQATRVVSAAIARSLAAALALTRTNGLLLRLENLLHHLLDCILQQLLFFAHEQSFPIDCFFA